jgi:hypothetical protein
MFLRKGSLSLSINAIVVLILAITILGLGLGFIRSQFGGMTKQFTSVSEEVDKELTDKIRQSGELLTFNKMNIEVTRGVESMFYIGISNTETEARCFKVLFKCVKPLTGTNCPSIPAAVNIAVGGNYPGAAPWCTPPACYSDIITTATLSWFKVFSDVNIQGLDVGVFPVYLQVGSATQDTYLMEVAMWKSTSTPGTSGCTPGGLPLSVVYPADPDQKKQFYVKVK